MDALDAIEQAIRDALHAAPAQRTPAQAEWLDVARRAGYDYGFVAPPNKALAALERAGLLERNPTTHGPYTHWRPTALGLLAR